MSHRALQRTLVRLLHDPTLLERMKRSGTSELNEPDLTEKELSWLREADPRAFLTDPYRQGRLMTSLVEELPTSCTLAANRLDGGLNGFFASALFHSAVREDRALRLGFADHLEQAGEDVRALVAIERGLMEARRATETASGELCIPMGVLWLEAPAGALELYDALWGELSNTGKPLVEAVLVLPQRPRPRTALVPGDIRTLLIEPDGAQGFHVGEIPSGLAAVLCAARDQGTRRACHAAALDCGAEPNEASEIIDEMISEGLLVCSPA